MRGFTRTLVCLASLGLVACDSGSDGPLCTPGASAACVCASGASGAQVCNPTGSGYEACVCAAGGEGGTEERRSEQPARAVDGAERRGTPGPGEIITIEPGGDTICSRGTPFRFFVRGGDPARVVIDFMGGGACWDAFSCEVDQEIGGLPIFQDAAEEQSNFEEALETHTLGGLYDFDAPSNPYAGWTVVRVPYCSGDFYWGDVTVDYAEDLTIHHRGFINAEAVSAWLVAHYPEATKIVSTGCEAGAYGSLNQALSLVDLYPEAEVLALGDSGAGVITDSFFADAFMTWNAFASMPLHMEGLAGKKLEDVTVTDLLVAASLKSPRLRVAQYISAHDTVQSFHYMFMGGEYEQWSQKAVASLEYVRARADNYRYYIAPGPIHCITPFDITYSREVDGVAYADWVRALIEDEALPEDVTCGDTCRDDPICAGCQDGSIESPACGWCEGWAP